MTYTAFMGYMIWPLLAYIAFLGIYIWFGVKNDDFKDVVITDENAQMSWSKRTDFLILLGVVGLNAFSILPEAKIGSLIISNMVWSSAGFAIYMIMKHLPSRDDLSSYIQWRMITIASVVICFGWFTGLLSEPIMAYTTATISTAGIVIAAAIGVVASFLLGKSFRYAAITVLLTKIFGMQYFLLFYIIELAGFLLSPSHHTFLVVQQYFGARIVPYVGVIFFLSATLVATAFAVTFGNNVW